MSIFSARKVKSGFTIIEVMLFLAISALMFVALVSSTSGSISRRRYDDAVSDFAEFLRRAYSDVESTQNARGDNNERFGCTLSSSASSDLYQEANTTDTAGRTNCGIYGKLLVFGESGTNANIRTYDVIGDIIDNTHKLSSGNLNLLEALKEVHAEILTYEKTPEGNCQIALAGGMSSYTPQWGAKIENTNSTHELFRGAVLIVRSPVNGTIHTLIAEFNGSASNFNLDSVLGGGHGCADSAVATAASSASTADVLLSKLIDASETLSYGLKNKAADFCVFSDDIYGPGRRDIRLHAEYADGTNASAVEVVEADGSNNKCL